MKRKIENPPKPAVQSPQKPALPERTLEEVEDYQRGQGKRKQDSEEA